MTRLPKGESAGSTTPSPEVFQLRVKSESGFSAALLQNDQPVVFASRTLTSTLRNYAQIEKECVAIVFGCQHFHQNKQEEQS